MVRDANEQGSFGGRANGRAAEEQWRGCAPVPERPSRSRIVTVGYHGHRGLRLGVPVALGLVVFAVGGDAQANGATGLGGMAYIFFGLVALVALLVSALLAVAGWVTAIRGPTSVGGIFGRGFLGVSAVFCFGIGAAALAGALDLYSAGSPDFVGPLLEIMVLVFLAFEFVIGATLYGRAHARAPSTMARVLSLICYGVAGLLILGAFGVAAMALFGPEPPDPDDIPIEDYRAGCESGNGHDCDLLGLRLQEGTGTRAPDEDAAAAAFRRGCDLGASMACLDAAGYYARHPERATPLHSEEIYQRRYTALGPDPARR